MPLSARIVNVLLPLPFNTAFSYQWPFDENPQVGLIVEVPFRNKSMFGIIDSCAGDYKSAALKSVESRSIAHPLAPSDYYFLNWMAHYTLIPRGLVLKMMLSVPQALAPARSRQRQLTLPAKPNPELRGLELSDAQQDAAIKLLEFLNQPTRKPILIEGVTGSGKTEVYFKAIAQALQSGQQCVVLLPEISLTPQWLGRFEKYFNCPPLIWHSNLTPLQRRNYWQWINQGHAYVVVGARSALLLPYHNLGLIIVDEEHDTSYKQEDIAFYHARDMAVARSFIAKIPCILASATPSLESIRNVQQGKYHHISLAQRYGVSQFPRVTLIDLKQHPINANVGWLSEPLITAMHEHIEKNEQTLLFLNRRGYAPLTLCQQCGFRIQCPNCTVWLVQHRSRHNLLCHYCGYQCQLPPQCPSCAGEKTWTACGPGVERLAEEVAKKLPQARLLIMASDLMTTNDTLLNAMTQIHTQQVDVIIGTQIMAKGHHFPHLTLVGIIDADVGLSGGDLRACEKTFQLLHQVAGRCGRAEYPGEVLIQSYNPTHPVMEALISADKDTFIQEELHMRETAEMPPYAKLASIIVQASDQQAGEQFTRLMRQRAPLESTVDLYGPSPAPLTFLRNKYRWRFLLKSNHPGILQHYIKLWMELIEKKPHNINVLIDIDPINFI